MKGDVLIIRIYCLRAMSIKLKWKRLSGFVDLNDGAYSFAYLIHL